MVRNNNDRAECRFYNRVYRDTGSIKNDSGEIMIKQPNNRIIFKCACDGYFNGAMCGSYKADEGTTERVCQLPNDVGCSYKRRLVKPSMTPVPAPVEVKKKPWLEKQVEEHLCKRMRHKSIGGECYKWASLNVRGVFDRICVFPGGKIFFVELKRDTKCKLSPGQDKFMTRMIALGVTDIVVLHGKEEVDAWVDMMAVKLL